MELQPSVEHLPLTEHEARLLATWVLDVVDHVELLSSKSVEPMAQRSLFRSAGGRKRAGSRSSEWAAACTVTDRIARGPPRRYTYDQQAEYPQPAG